MHIWQQKNTDFQLPFCFLKQKIKFSILKWENPSPPPDKHTQKHSYPYFWNIFTNRNISQKKNNFKIPTCLNFVEDFFLFQQFKLKLETKLNQVPSAFSYILNQQIILKCWNLPWEILFLNSFTSVHLKSQLLPWNSDSEGLALKTE